MEASTQKKISEIILFVTLMVIAPLSSAKAQSADVTHRKIILEKLLLEGSTRVDHEFLEEELKLTPGQNLSPSFLQEVN